MESYPPPSAQSERVPGASAKSERRTRVFYTEAERQLKQRGWVLDYWQREAPQGFWVPCRICGTEVRTEVPRDAGVLVSERQHLGDLGGALTKAVPAIDAAACRIELPERGLRALPIGPEVGRRGVRL